MNRRTIFALALCGGLLPAAFVSSAAASNVAWGVSVGGPGFSVAVGQPGLYGTRGFYRAPFFPLARPHFRPVYRAVLVASPPAPFALAAPAPLVFAPRHLFLVPQIVGVHSASYWRPASTPR